MSKQVNFWLGLSSTVGVSLGSVTVLTSNPVYGFIIIAVGAVCLAIREYLKDNPLE